MENSILQIKQERLRWWMYPFTDALTIGTTIYIKPKPNEIEDGIYLKWHQTLNHEKIHVVQFLELYKEDTYKNRVKWVLLHIKYNIVEKLTGKMNPLEKEAYNNSWDMDYIKKMGYTRQ